jgi:hypothetical protein
MVTKIEQQSWKVSHQSYGAEGNMPNIVRAQSATLLFGSHGTAQHFEDLANHIRTILPLELKKVSHYVSGVRWVYRWVQ